MSKASKAEANKEKEVETVPTSFVFGKRNYRLMLIGIGVIVLGFALMYGGTEDINSFRKITLAPIVVVAGFIVEIFAIMAKPGADNGDS
jgi:hypothetical protein